MKLPRIPITTNNFRSFRYPETFPTISNPTQQDRPVLARFFNGTATSIISSYSRNFARSSTSLRKVSRKRNRGIRNMYEPSTRSRDVYMYVYIRKQWHNRDSCITIEKRHVIKCCPKVIDMEINGKM